MIVGLYVRYYKNYSKLHFVPFVNKEKTKSLLLIGKNGSGKSSILESLDTFFNNKKWNLTISEKSRKKDAYIAPIFLIKKNNINFNGKNRTRIEKAFNHISDFYWGLSDSGTPNQPLKKFLRLKENFGNIQNDYFLLCLGKNPSNNYFIPDTFKNSLLDFLASNEYIKSVDETDKTYEQLIKDISDKIFSIYTYVYLPVDIDYADALKLERDILPQFMPKSTQEEIDNFIKQASVKYSETEPEKNLIEYLNSQLKDFLKNIQEKLGKDYEIKFKNRDYLMINDVREMILSSYLARTRLLVQDKEIFDLSSGQKKQTLLDTIIKLSEHKTKKDLSKELIVAIDEPESSLHYSEYYRQFYNLKEFIDRTENQTLIATHWYGALPIFDNAIINYIKCKSDEQVEVFSFESNTYFEKSQTFGEDDQEIKSLFDLSSSLYGMVVHINPKLKFLIVEGNSDRIYISNHLDSKYNTSNLKIIPVGGRGKVIKMFSNFANIVNNYGKDIVVVCLIDTDKDQDKWPTSNKEKNVSLLRLQEKNSGYRVVDLNDEEKSPSDIEDALVPKNFFEAIDKTITLIGDSEIAEKWKKFDFNNACVKSSVYDLDGILTPKHNEFKNDLKDIQDFCDSNKVSIANNYEVTNELPLWVENLAQRLRLRKI